MQKSPPSHDATQASIAIALRPRSAQAAIDDETLAAFCDNRLDEKARETVMQALANDESLYRRWIDLQQDLAVVEQPQTQAATSPSFVERIKSLRRWFALGGGFTAVTASALVVALYLPVINYQLYGVEGLDDGQYYDVNPTSLLTSKGVQQTTISNAMASGLVHGIESKTVEPDAWQTLLSPLKSSALCLPSQCAGKDYMAGQWLALSYLQCPTASAAERDDMALVARHLSNQSEVMAPLVNTSGDAVCGDLNKVMTTALNANIE